MGIPENIDTLLVKFDLKPEGLAKIAGVTTATISRWRTGNTENIRRANLEKICKALELTPDDILSSTAGLAAQEHGHIGGSIPAVPFKTSSAMVPVRVLGRTHAGDRMDEDESDYEVEFPKTVVSRHPGCFALTVEGECMNRRFRSGDHILVDPNMEPHNGSAVVAEFSDGRSLVRSYLRGSSTLILAPDSYLDGYEDTVIAMDDEPVKLLGVVFWNQAGKESE